MSEEQRDEQAPDAGEELQDEDGELLPDREVMTILDPGVGGNLGPPQLGDPIVTLDDPVD